MQSVHLKVRVSPNGEVTTETCVANATAWLIDDIGNIDTFHEVFTKPWQGDVVVHFHVRITNEQRDAVEQSEVVTYLQELE